MRTVWAHGVRSFGAKPRSTTRGSPLEVLAERPATQLQRWPINRAVLPLVPLNKQLLLQRQKLQADFATDALTFSDGAQITDQMRPAQLPLLNGEVVVSREAIAHHNALKGTTQQFDRRSG